MSRSFIQQKFYIIIPVPADVLDPSGAKPFTMMSVSPQISPQIDLDIKIPNKFDSRCEASMVRISAYVLITVNMKPISVPNRISLFISFNIAVNQYA